MNIGFYLLDIDASNIYHKQILESIDSLCKLRPSDEIVLFNDVTKTAHPNLGYYILHINEAKYFKGLLFVFDTKSLILTKTFPSPSKQIFIVNEADWVVNKTVNYNVWNSMYNNNNIELFTIGKSLNDLCEICWKKPLHNADILNGESINDVLQKL